MKKPKNFQLTNNLTNRFVKPKVKPKPGFEWSWGDGKWEEFWYGDDCDDSSPDSDDNNNVDGSSRDAHNEDTIGDITN